MCSFHYYAGHKHGVILIKYFAWFLQWDFLEKFNYRRSHERWKISEVICLFGQTFKVNKRSSPYADRLSPLFCPILQKNVGGYVSIVEPWNTFSILSHLCSFSWSNDSVMIRGKKHSFWPSSKSGLAIVADVAMLVYSGELENQLKITSWSENDTEAWYSCLHKTFTLLQVPIVCSQFYYCHANDPFRYARDKIYSPFR